MWKVRKGKLDIKDDIVDYFAKEKIDEMVEVNIKSKGLWTFEK